MNNQHSPSSHMRRRVYIDHQLQGRLLAALIILEVSMLAVAIGYLYVRFNLIIEDNLYSAHASSREPLTPIFIHELLRLILVMALVNTLALLSAHLLWTRHIRSILQRFRAGLKRFAALDLRRPQAEPEPSHEVLLQLQRWQEAERRRMRRYLDLTAQLPETVPDPCSEQQRQTMRQILLEAKQLLGVKN